MSDEEFKTRLEAIKQRTEKSSPEPWILEHDKDGDPTEIHTDPRHTEAYTGINEEDIGYHTICKLPVEKYGYGCTFVSEENGQFISNARQDIPWLVEQIEKLQVENKNLKDAIDYIDECLEERNDGYFEWRGVCRVTEVPGYMAECRSEELLDV